MKAHEISLLGRLWKDHYGNSYHTARIKVNGEFVYTTPVTYGYGGQYEQTAKKWLSDNEHIKETEYPTTLRRFCDDNGIRFDSVSVDVKFKKELS